MSILRLVLGAILGLLSISVFVEFIELTIVVSISELDFASATNPENQQLYFITRNTPVILATKMVYSLVGGIIGGIIASLIAGEKAKLAVITVVTLQIISLIWAGFFSEFSITGPNWMWVALMIIIPIGIWTGHQRTIKMKANKRSTK